MTEGSRLPDAATVARMLAGDILALVGELLPAARRQGREMVAGSLRGEAGRSLSICIGGSRAGIWGDFSSGERGDALDLVAGVLFAGDKGAAWRWGLRRLGYTPPGEAPQPGQRPAPLRAPAPTQRDPGPDAEALAKRRKALALFAEAAPLTGQDPASLYLAARGLDLRELGRIPRALRFHRNCWCAEASTPLPALLAAITDAQGEQLAVHRIYLRQDGDAWRKAALDMPKKAMGGYVGGHVPIWRGTAGTPLREAQPGETVALTEGVEDALAVAMLMPAWRVLASISLANLARVALPDAITAVTLVADNDAPDSPASTALRRAVEAHTAAGRQVRVARAPGGAKDFAEILQEAVAAAEEPHDQET